MLNYQQIVSDVRSSIYMDGEENADFLRAAAADYLVACDETNQRLLRCSALLRRGETSEALRLCEMEPNLLDVVAALDFPEREQWEQFIGEYGLIAPPPIAVDVASELNEAYALAQPLATLMQRHRLLAIGRAPLKLRLQVLRKLAALDAGSPLWLADVESFEKERLKELVSEVSAAAHDKNAETMEMLEEELVSEPWTVAPPQSLVRRATEARWQIYREQVQAELKEIESDLSTAFANGDVGWGCQLRDRWNAIAGDSGLPGGHPLLLQAQPALDWLTEQDAQQEEEANRLAAAADLERGLSRHSSQYELNNLYHKATANGWSVSPALEQRYETQLTMLQRSRRRKQWMIVGSGVLAVGLTVWGIVAAIGYYSFHRDIANATAVIQQLIEEGKLEDAQQFFSDLDRTKPAITHSEDLQVAKVKLEQLVADRDKQRAAEIERQAAFREHLKTTTDEAMQAMSPTLLHSLRDEARTKEEKHNLETAISVVTKHRDEALHAKLGLIQNQFDERDRAHPRDKDYLVYLSTLVRQAQDLRAMEVSEAVRREADELLARIEDRSKAVESASRAEKQVVLAEKEADLIAASVGNIAEYRLNLEQYSKKFQGTVRANDFKVVTGELKLLEWLSSRNEAIVKEREFTQNPNSKAAQLLAELLDKYINQGGEGPAPNRFTQRLEYVNAFAARQEDGVRLEHSLDEWFKDPLKAECLMVIDSEGRRYYCREQPKASLTRGFVRVQYIVDLNSKTASIRLEDATVPLPAPPAPQNEIARKVSELLQNVNDKNWEPNLSRVIIAIAAPHQPEIDPILKVIMLHKSVSVASKGGYCLRKAFEGQLNKLAGSNVGDQANWVSPNDPEVKLLRDRVRKSLDSLDSMKNSVSLAGSIWAECQKPLGTRYEWIGWLRKLPDGKWTIEPKTDSRHSGPLFVLQRQGNLANDKIVFDEIGKLHDGRIELLPAKHFIEGRPALVALSGADPGVR